MTKRISTLTVEQIRNQNKLRNRKYYAAHREQVNKEHRERYHRNKLKTK